MNEPTQSRKLAKAQRVVEARQRGAQTLSDTASCRAYVSTLTLTDSHLTQLLAQAGGGGPAGSRIQSFGKDDERIE